MLVLHESLFVSVLMYGSGTMLWREKERILRDIRRMERVPNVWIRELCRVKKGLDERIDENLLSGSAGGEDGE